MNTIRAGGAAPTAGSEVSSPLGLCWVLVCFASLLILLCWNAHQHLGDALGWFFSIFLLCEGCRSLGSRASSCLLIACTMEPGKVCSGLQPKVWLAAGSAEVTGKTCCKAVFYISSDFLWPLVPLAAKVASSAGKCCQPVFSLGLHYQGFQMQVL